MNKLIFTLAAGEALRTALATLSYDKLFVVADSNTAPLLSAAGSLLTDAELVVVAAGEKNKNILTLQTIWEAMLSAGLTRRSLLVTFGGGVVSDIGGFAAATYMRSVPYINIPTTLLAAVDASVGGKTAIDFNGYKNIIGAFHRPLFTIISPQFFGTLPRPQVLSGVGEMLKHAVISGDEAALVSLLSGEIFEMTDAERLRLIEQSVDVKSRIVEADPLEKGERKILNLGHTIGHALESLWLLKGSTKPHGYAVAWGLAVEMALSESFPLSLRHTVEARVKELFGPIDIEEADFPLLLQFMRRDKKNRGGGEINFSLPVAMGSVAIDCSCTEAQILAALRLFLN